MVASHRQLGKVTKWDDRSDCSRRPIGAIFDAPTCAAPHRRRVRLLHRHQNPGGRLGAQAQPQTAPTVVLRGLIPLRSRPSYARLQALSRRAPSEGQR